MAKTKKSSISGLQIMCQYQIPALLAGAQPALILNEHYVNVCRKKNSGLSIPRRISHWHPSPKEMHPLYSDVYAYFLSGRVGKKNKKEKTPASKLPEYHPQKVLAESERALNQFLVEFDISYQQMQQQYPRLASAYDTFQSWLKLDMDVALRKDYSALGRKVISEKDVLKREPFYWKQIRKIDPSRVCSFS